MGLRRIAWLLVLVLALAACGGDEPADPPEPDPPAAEPEPPEEPEPELAQECTNEQYGFTIRYPEGWHTNDEGPLPACSFFHPSEFDIPEATEVTEFAVMTRREPVELERIAGEDPGVRVLDRDDLEVDGRPAVRRLAEATGEGLFPEGLQYTQFFVDLNGETLVLETYDVDGLDYEANVDVLEEMVASLELDAATADEGADAVGEPQTGALELEGTPDMVGNAHLVDVRVARHDDFDRVVLEFEGGERPGARIEPADGPIVEDPSGRELNVPGQTYLEVSLSPATAVDLSGAEPRETYDGSDRIDFDGHTLVHLAIATDHHGALRWVLGLRQQSAFAAAFLEEPLRLVVDVFG
jgi:hypothetical protein